MLLKAPLAMMPIAEEQRDTARIATALVGKLFVPDEKLTLACEIIDLSPDGAGLRCAPSPPPNAFVVLYIEGFGRFQGLATRQEDGVVGMCFICHDAKRDRLKQDLLSYVQGGQMPPTRLRGHRRDGSCAIGHFTRANGENIACDVLDISLQGLSLRTERFPPVGEIVDLGQTKGRVVRHHADGIAIHFLAVAHDSGRPHGS